MSVAPDREKELPDIPADIDDSRAVVEGCKIWTTPSPQSATLGDANESVPSIEVGNTLSEEEMRSLRELWNEAGLSARAHRRRRRDQDAVPWPIPAPISIPEPVDIAQAPSADPSVTSTTAPITGTRKRWGFLSARPFSETQVAERKTPNRLEKLRAMAQSRLKKKLRYAKSVPNLGDQATPLERDVTSQLVVALSAETAEDGEHSSPRSLEPPGKLATPTSAFRQEDMDENAIYFTIDPSWRASQGSVRLECITPIPDGLASFGRPDSPLLHRYHSLDQLSLAAQQVARSSTAPEGPEVWPRYEAIDPIDELHAFLEL